MVTLNHDRTATLEFLWSMMPSIVSLIENRSASFSIIMEFCGGGDLYQSLKKQRGRMFPEKQVLDWFVQVREADPPDLAPMPEQL